jgi:hypothetical protein
MTGETPARAPVRPLADRLAAQHFLLEHLRSGGAIQALVSLTPLQWVCLVEEAARHRLGPLVWRRLVDGPWAETLPAEPRERLRSLYVRNAYRNATLLRETAQAVEALAAAGIPTMLLKGVHLSGFVYEEPALRSMADIDIMVPRGKLAEAERIFVARGYGPEPRADLEAFCAWSNHLEKLEKPGAGVIEIHYAIERPTSPFRIDTDALWARARAVRVSGVQAWALCDEDLLLHICLHTSYHHHFDRSALKGLVDVQTLLVRRGSALDWDRVVAVANEWGIGNFVYCTLQLVHTILNVNAPTDVLARLAHEPVDEEMTRIAARYILAPQVDLPEAYLAMKRTTNRRERLAMFLRSVFLPREQLRQMYALPVGSMRVYPYYIVRLLELIKRRGVLLLRVFVRSGTVAPTLDRERDRREIERWVQRAPAGAAAP